MQIFNHHLIFSDANDFVDSLPKIPFREQAKSDEENHGKFSILFNKKGQTRISNAVYKAAYWGNRRDYLQEKPKDDVDPTIVLQFMMLHPTLRYNKEQENAKGNTPLHLASARGNLEAVRILMESKATTYKEPINRWYFISLEKLGYEHEDNFYFKKLEIWKICKWF